MKREELEQKVLTETIEEAMAPYAYLFTEAGHTYLREILEDVFATHPVTAELLELLLPPPTVQESGTVPKEADAAGADSSDTERNVS